MSFLFQPYWISLSSTPQPTFADITSRFSGPFSMWSEEAAQGSLYWPTGEDNGGWSMEVSVNVIIVEMLL